MSSASFLCSNEYNFENVEKTSTHVIECFAFFDEVGSIGLHTSEWTSSNFYVKCLISSFLNVAFLNFLSKCPIHSLLSVRSWNSYGSSKIMLFSTIIVRLLGNMWPSRACQRPAQPCLNDVKAWSLLYAFVAVALNVLSSPFTFNKILLFSHVWGKQYLFEKLVELFCFEDPQLNLK